FGCKRSPRTWVRGPSSAAVCSKVNATVSTSSTSAAAIAPVPAKVTPDNMPSNSNAFSQPLSPSRQLRCNLRKVARGEHLVEELLDRRGIGEEGAGVRAEEAFEDH